MSLALLAACVISLSVLRTHAGVPGRIIPEENREPCSYLRHVCGGDVLVRARRSVLPSLPRRHDLGGERDRLHRLPPPHLCELGQHQLHPLPCWPVHEQHWRSDLQGEKSGRACIHPGVSPLPPHGAPVICSCASPPSLPLHHCLTWVRPALCTLAGAALRGRPVPVEHGPAHLHPLPAWLCQCGRGNRVWRLLAGVLRQQLGILSVHGAWPQPASLKAALPHPGRSAAAMLRPPNSTPLPNARSLAPRGRSPQTKAAQGASPAPRGRPRPLGRQTALLW